MGCTAAPVLRRAVDSDRAAVLHPAKASAFQGRGACTPGTVTSMAKGKATKATRATKTKVEGSKAAKPAPGKAAAKAAPEPTRAKATAAPEKAPPVAPAASPGVQVAKKKKNVKRGAPPMLPRRMARRPEAGTPGAPPPPPRPAAPPGSLHAPARAPEGAESLKQRLSTVMTLVAQLRALKRTLNRQFYDAGLVLQKLSDPELYKAKGYGSFESFIEREVERELSIGRSLAHDLVQIVRVFQRGPAEEIGLDRLRAALRALWPESGPQTAASPTPATSG